MPKEPQCFYGANTNKHVGMNGDELRWGREEEKEKILSGAVLPWKILQKHVARRAALRVPMCFENSEPLIIHNIHPPPHRLYMYAEDSRLLLTCDTFTSFGYHTVSATFMINFYYIICSCVSIFIIMDKDIINSKENAREKS